MLNKSIQIGNVKVCNRVVLQPMEGCDCNIDGSPSDLTIEKYRKAAKSGAGLIWFEANAVCPEGRTNPHQMMLTPENLPQFQSLLQQLRTIAMESQGICPVFILQLTHSGRQSIAIALYADHGIDLYHEPLEIAVCAQHCNGGVAVDGNWQSEIEGLYAAGEAAGTFGVYRPGGTALNSTQVGSLRAAEHIAKKPAKAAVASTFTLPQIRYGKSNIKAIREEYCQQMSNAADFDRSSTKMQALFDKVCRLCEDFFSVAQIENARELAALFKLYDMALTQRSVLSAMLCSAEAIGTHGSAFVDRLPDRSANKIRATRTITRGSVSTIEPISNMPNPELWFETLLARQERKSSNESIL